MELEVRLSRAGAEPWGFRLVGGADSSIPLTVLKVIPSSPADHANLQNGDAVTRIDGADAASMTHEGAKAAVAAASGSLELRVVRGLYDPVLDDFDPTYEPIDQDDFDQPSQPTEVFQIKDFNVPNSDYPDFPQSEPGADFRSRSQSHGPDRSLTESPFLLPTKPYRPFSTEPTPVPALEDPIILNPEYHDEFGKLDGLDRFEDAVYGETKFKLPISEQYDPDGTRLKKKKEDNVGVVIGRASEVTVTTVTSVSSVEETKLREQKEEIKYMEKMKKEIDLDKIEMTATSIVDESIEKAITVADEIRKEIDVELKTVTSELKAGSTDVTESKSAIKIDKKESIQEVNELIAIIDNTTHVIIKESDVSVTKEVAKFESVEKQETSTAGRKAATKQEIEEIIETGSVRSKSKMYDKEVKITETKAQRKSVDETQTEIKESKTRSDVKEVQSSHKVKQSEFKSEQISKTGESTTKSDENVNKEAKYTTAKLLAEQRAYTIGLQTIPHIKGTVQSSYHYDLLLKTFFIHLTDVMVALSRFILTEPVFSKPLERKEEVTKVNKEMTEVKQDTVKKVVEDTVVRERKVEKDEVIHEQIISKNFIKENQAVEERAVKVSEAGEINHAPVVDEQEYRAETVINDFTEKKMRSGAEMAQLTEKRSEELIHKMDGVITEFQVKAGLEEEIALQRERRSRSRSRIEEEVMKESDPLEWLSKVDKKSEEVTELKTSKSILESTEIKRESRHETKEVTNESKYEIKEESSSDGKNTYIAIVEAHVYTNKNAILDAMTASCETTSEQSIKETNVELEVNKAIVNESVSIETETIKERAGFTESHEMSSSQSETVTVEEKKEAMQDVQMAVEVETKEVAKIEIVETAQPIVELQEDIVEKVDVRVELKNELNIQEIQSSEYVGELNVIKEDIVECSEQKEMAMLKEDIQISQEVAEIQESVMKEEIKERSEVMVSMNSESISIAESKEVSQDIKMEEDKTYVSESITEVHESKVETKDESAQVKVTKEEITEITESVEIDQEIEVNIRKSVQINESQNQYQTFVCESSVDNTEFIQEEQVASFTAKFASSESAETSSTKTAEDKKSLSLELKKSDSQSSIKNTIDTPTPSTVPPTPLTDEYVFRLQAPLPKLTGPPIPRSPSPEDEDPHIVKKKLIPHIDTEIIEEVVYDTPLLTPPGDKVAPPVYTKPGLRGGNMRFMFKKKEEILEIERKSSLLASAIDETIKSIEEYKEEVGIDTKVEQPIVYNGFAKVIETKVFNLDKEPISVEQQVIKNTDTINKIVENRDSVKTAEILANGIEKIEHLSTGAKMGENEDVTVDGYRPVPFNPDDAPHLERVEILIPGPTPTLDPGKAFVTPDGGILGTHQGIVDGLEEAIVNDEVAKELGKPGMTEEKIAELISGESEMLREAHVMGLSRVLKSHMHKNDDDSSVDFKKIKPIVESLKDSEVLKALNEEFMRTQEEKKKEERKWTKFLQKPSRPVPRAKFGYYGYVADEEDVESPYKVKIVKQPKPKVAPDYKPKDFNTGPLPWEERARNEPPPPPVEAEEPILVPEEGPEFLEAIDNLPESEVPDLEETGIPLPPEKVAEDPQPEPAPEAEVVTEEEPQLDTEAVVEETNTIVLEMEEKRIADQLLRNVEGMVDPNASLEQQLAQMRAQLAALAQLPGVIQQTLELVTRQLCQITQQESQQTARSTQAVVTETTEAIEESNENCETTIEDVTEEREEATQNGDVIENGVENGEEIQEEQKQQEKMSAVGAEEIEKMKREEQEILGEQRRIEKQKKELMAELQLDQESRQLKQRPTPRVGKPRPAFGPLTPAERPLVLPGGRKWRKPQDAYNDQFIAETLTAQAELIQGKALGKTYESVHLPYDERVNFMKYEKPPVSLDHLQNSDVYKLVHNMEAAPARRVDMLTPVVAEADYREKCRSMTPSVM